VSDCIRLSDPIDGFVTNVFFVVTAYFSNNVGPGRSPSDYYYENSNRRQLRHVQRQPSLIPNPATHTNLTLNSLWSSHYQFNYHQPYF